jgi:hypothetical protein
VVRDIRWQMQKLVLEGHVFGREYQKASSYYTWQKSTSLEDVLDHIKRFDRAFVLVKMEYIHEPRRIRCRTASELLGL